MNKLKAIAVVVLNLGCHPQRQEPQGVVPGWIIASYDYAEQVGVAI
jgi:hypothetical protein